jgi:glycosyltransferase involved in cell wall biosynthesis
MISILLATHNGERYLKQSIKSVLDQTFTEFELLIGLNGTTDGSKEIIESFEDSRIKIFEYDQPSKSKTLNKLIGEAKYDWISIQDDDDIWIDIKLESQINYTKEFDVIGTFINYINENGNIIGSPNLSMTNETIKSLSLSGNNQVANTSAIFKKSIALENNGWREDIDGIEDFDFWLRLMRMGKTFMNIPNVLVLHRVHTQSNFNTKKYDLNQIL